ncbi:hypothetical protein J4Q44_G00147030 [Coregonus suidteri]|uniref:Uncharacterized protein n=1 Tax=Coregonus suidteri TaxID=861788 RepID=A0AAN8LS94_9TELE
MNTGTRIGELTNQTLKTAMSLDWYQEGWENNLKVILFAHNSSIQASTEYGWEPQLLTEGYLRGSQQSSTVGAVGRSTTESTDALHFSEAQ